MSKVTKTCRYCQAAFVIRDTSRQRYCSQKCREDHRALLASDLPNEMWLPVMGYESRYLVSNLGRIKSIRNNLLMKFGKSKGYNNVSFWSDDLSTKETFTVHALVALHFVGPSHGLQVRHLDGYMFNNAATNLAWGTALENAADRDRHATTRRGVSHVRSVFTENDIREIRSLAARGIGSSEIGRLFGKSKTTIHSVVKRVTWKHVS